MDTSVLRGTHSPAHHPVVVSSLSLLKRAAFQGLWQYEQPCSLSTALICDSLETRLSGSAQSDDKLLFLGDRTWVLLAQIP